ncbi:unnamed protein product [Cuscuta epithymum]|uniref:TF-B3 domain-containing protein n=1 Tax=Cuscuta epithymum TaxID=186058 RepID=A0AAV0FUZ9_9ASTE|nr:unnamed protein product [Cuscuta epithymum]
MGKGQGSSRRRRGQGTPASKSSEMAQRPPPHFFKVILPLRTTLMIPKEFIRKHGKNLPKVGSFEVPTGEIWEIDLVHSQGHVFLAKGWKEFAENYSIGDGHFLVFRYDRKSHFSVIIFDKSASEIEYPLPKSQDDEILEEVEAEGGPNKRRRKEKFGSKCKMKLEKSLKSGGSPSLNPKNKSSKTYLQQSYTEGTRKSKKVTNAAYQRAKSFKSQNPFHIALMYQSYVSSPYTLTIPLRFAEKQFSRKRNDVVLVWGGKSWPAKCVFCKLQKVNINGWKRFAVDNHLEVGDVCILEVVRGHHSRSPLIIDVTIFRFRTTS